MALGQLSRQTISDIGTAEDSEEWRVCNRFYATARDFVLEDVWWGFNKRIVALALLTETPREWAYMYARPSGALVIRYLLPNYTIYTSNDDITIIPEYLDSPVQRWPREVPFEPMQASDGAPVICTNESDAYCCYSVRETDTARYSAGMVNALMWYLTHLIAMPLKGAKQGYEEQKAALNAYQFSISTAGRNDLNQHRLQQRPDSDITLARM